MVATRGNLQSNVRLSNNEYELAKSLLTYFELKPIVAERSNGFRCMLSHRGWSSEVPMPTAVEGLDFEFRRRSGLNDAVSDGLFACRRHYRRRCSGRRRLVDGVWNRSSLIFLQL